MAAERFFIYRRGATDSFALTAAKGEPRLRTGSNARGWEFWMMVTRDQIEDEACGFAFEAAVAKIKADGFFVFTGTSKLLHRGLSVQAPPGGA